MPTWAWILVASAGITLGIAALWAYIIYRDAQKMAQM